MRGKYEKSILIVRESIIILSALVAIYILISLASYQHADGTWLLSEPEQTSVKNLGGILGATLSHILLQLFGYSAYLIALLVAALGLVISRKLEHIPEQSTSQTWTVFTLAGAILLIIALPTLESLHYGQTTNLPNGAGGSLGLQIATNITKITGYTGASLLMLGILVAGLSLTGNFSWLSLCEKVGTLTLLGISNVYAMIIRYRDKQAGKAELAKRKRELQQTQQQTPHSSRTIITPKTTKDIFPTSSHKAPIIDKKSTSIAKAKPDSVNQVSQNAMKKSISNKANANADNPLEYQIPNPNSLKEAPLDQEISEETLQYLAGHIEKILQDFNIEAKVLEIHPGPVITRFDIRPALGIKGAQVVNISKDLARALSVNSIRVLETVPGKSCMGLEVPNPNRQEVFLKQLITSSEFKQTKASIPLALGKDATGKIVVEDMTRMPHLLVAGTTGSGKSVCINALILSMLYRFSPAELALIMIDPKMLELNVYHEIPHLLMPVITDMQQVPLVLQWTINEMERRYQLMADNKVRNIASYNKLLEQSSVSSDSESDEPPAQPLPQIVLIIDELADLMMICGKQVEQPICRIAQKARASGIYLILATQRPSVDVVTGLIKANVPSRIAFQVSARADSRTVLDQIGAEALLGSGDMLYLPIGASTPLRVHGAFVSEEEIEEVTSQIIAQKHKSNLIDYQEQLRTNKPSEQDLEQELDELYQEAVNFVLSSKKASISLVQRKFRIGYNRAARIIEQMEYNGILSEANENGTRTILER